MTVTRALVRSALLLAVSLPVAAHAAGKPEPADQPKLVGESLVVKTHSGKLELEGYDPKACFPVTEIRINGIEVVAVEEIRKKVEPLAIKCLDNALASALVKAVNEVHSDKGYVTTQGFLPDQDIRADKRLVINVYTGRIGKIIYSEPDTDEALPIGQRWSNGWKKVSEAKGLWGLLRATSEWIDTLDDPLDNFQLLDAKTAARVKQWMTIELEEGDVVNVDDVQRNADFMNRTSSNHTEAKFEAGDRSATSNVLYENKRKDSFRLNIGYETNGAALNGTGSTVDRRVRIDLAKDNLIGINDAWRGSLASGINTNEATAAFSVPFRRFTFGLNGSYSESLSNIASGVEFFTRTGIVSGSLSYALEHNNKLKSSIDSSLTWRRGDRHINDARLSEQTFSIARIGFSRTHLMDTSNFYYSAGVNKGLAIWDAMRDGPNPPPDMPRAQFWKIDASTGYSKGFKDIGTFKLDVTGQWTAHPLHSDDQLTLGSSTSIRGFTNTAAKVDKGFVARSEFAFVLPADRILGDTKDNLVLAHEILTSAQPYVFFDYGYGWDIANKREVSRSGAGFGLRYQHGRLNFDIAYAHPVTDSGAPNKRGPEIYLTASLKLF